MPGNKAKKKCDCKNCKCKDCACCGLVDARSFFPACFLACIVTAVLVTLFFAVGFTAIFSYGYGVHKGVNVANFKGIFSEEYNSAKEDEILKISTGATIDFFVSGHTGFIYASADDCGERCTDFETRLMAAATEKEVANQVFHYNYPAYNKPENPDKLAKEMVIASEDAPVLLYVRNGRIYDRLDETNGDLAVAAFLAKYK